GSEEEYGSYKGVEANRARSALRFHNQLRESSLFYCLRPRKYSSINHFIFQFLVQGGIRFVVGFLLARTARMLFSSSLRYRIALLTSSGLATRPCPGTILRGLVFRIHCNAWIWPLIRASSRFG